MICPNCGANNTARSTFCRRCRQRLPQAGLASGVTYPRRRNVANDTSGSRLAIYAAIFLAIVAFVVGAILVGLSRPQAPAGSFVAVATQSPESSLPIFEQPTPEPTPFVDPTASPTPLPFPSLAASPTAAITLPPESPTPAPEPTPTPTERPDVTPSPTPRPTREPTPTPTPTQRPTPTPTPTPTQRPTPTPTPTPAPIGCQGNSGRPTGSVTVGPLQPSAETGNWCLQTVSYRFFEGSAYGTIRVLHNGRPIGTFTCEVGQNCAGPIVEPVAGRPRLAVRGDTLRFRVLECQDAPETPQDDCQTAGVIATIEVGYRPATQP